MLAPGWGTRTRGGSPPGVKLGSLPVMGMFHCMICLQPIAHSMSLLFNLKKRIFEVEWRASINNKHTVRRELEELSC